MGSHLPTGGGSGANTSSAISMEDALHKGTGFIAAAKSTSAPTLNFSKGPSAEELSKLTDALIEAFQRHRRWEASDETPNDLHRYARLRERHPQSHDQVRNLASQKPDSSALYEAALISGVDVSSVASARKPDDAVRRLQEDMERRKIEQIEQAKEAKIEQSLSNLPAMCPKI